MELFPENLLNYLPAESHEKVLFLDEQRNAAMAANKAAGDALFEAYERRDALAVKAQYAVEGSVSGLGRKLADEDREAIFAPVRKVEREIEEKLKPRAERAAKAFEDFAFLDEVSAWLRDVKAVGIRLFHAPLPVVKGDFHRVVENQRRRLDDLENDWHTASNAPRPLEDARAAIVAEIDRLAAKGAPVADMRIREGSPVKFAYAFGITGEHNLHATLAHAVIWMAADTLKERALALLGDADPVGAMADADRDAVFDRITAERFDAERTEEAAIAAAAVVGIVIVRRRDADPRAILEVAEGR